MRTELLQQWGPSYTPKVIRFLITITAVTSLSAALLDKLLRHLTGLPGLEGILSLSYWGISHGLLWQPVTYLFVTPTFGLGVTLGLIMTLLFQMYLLWIAGTAVLERVGPSPFLRLYLASGILTGLAVLLVMVLTETHLPLAGPSAPILAVLVVWAMLYPDMQLLLFLTIPAKIRYLVFGYLAIVLFIDLAQLNLIDLTLNLVAGGTGYLYGTVAWELQSPFAFSQRLDAKLNELGLCLRSRRSSSSSKIVNIWGQAPKETDDEFLDAMLTKISAQGERSLSWQEKRRLSRISKNKKAD